MAMIANNLSTLGISAAQLDNTFDTQFVHAAVAADHRRVRSVGDVRRLRLSREARDAPRGPLHAEHRRQTEQPGTNAIENSQIRLTDGSQIFTPDLFGRVKREFFKDLFVGLSLYNTYDNHPPNPTANTNDVGVVVSIGWSY
jgi:hypothetical protein